MYKLIKNFLILGFMTLSLNGLTKEIEIKLNQLASEDNTHIVVSNGIHNISLKCTYNKNIATCQKYNLKYKKLLIFVKKDNKWNLI